MFCPWCSFWMDIRTHNDVVLFHSEWSFHLGDHVLWCMEDLGFDSLIYLFPLVTSAVTLCRTAVQAHLTQSPSLPFPSINFILQLQTLWADLLHFWHAIQYSSASFFCLGMSSCTHTMFLSLCSPAPSMLFKSLTIHKVGLTALAHVPAYHYSFLHGGFAVCFKLRKFWASNFFITYKIVLSVCRLLKIHADFMEFPAIIFSLLLWEHLFWPVSSATLRACRLLQQPQITFQHCECYPKGGCFM